MPIQIDCMLCLADGVSKSLQHDRNLLTASVFCSCANVHHQKACMHVYTVPVVSIVANIRDATHESLLCVVSKCGHLIAWIAHAS